MSREDWTAVSDKFKIARAVLADDFDGAAQLMSRIGPKGNVLNGGVPRLAALQRVQEVASVSGNLSARLRRACCKGRKRPRERERRNHRRSSRRGSPKPGAQRFPPVNSGGRARSSRSLRGAYTATSRQTNSIAARRPTKPAARCKLDRVMLLYKLRNTVTRAPLLFWGSSLPKVALRLGFCMHQM